MPNLIDLNFVYINYGGVEGSSTGTKVCFTTFVKIDSNTTLTRVVNISSFLTFLRELLKYNNDTIPICGSGYNDISGYNNYVLTRMMLDRNNKIKLGGYGANTNTLYSNIYDMQNALNYYGSQFNVVVYVYKNGQWEIYD